MHRSWLSPVAFGEWQEKHQIRTVSHSEGLPGNNLPFLLVGRGHFPGLEHSAGYSDLFFLDIAASRSHPWHLSLEFFIHSFITHTIHV